MGWIMIGGFVASAIFGIATVIYVPTDAIKWDVGAFICLTILIGLSERVFAFLMGWLVALFVVGFFTVLWQN